MVLISEEVADRLLPKFSKKVEERDQSIRAVQNGSVEQLTSLVHSVASGEVSNRISHNHCETPIF